MPDLYTLIIIAAAALGLLVIIFAVITISNSIKLKKIMQNCENGDLAKTIAEYYERLAKSENSINSLRAEFDRYEEDNKNGLQHVGIVNFDAYEDISGRMSFSVAVLNRSNNGFILTSLYGHELSNVYIRVIVDGVSQTYLTDEEKQALQQAMSSAEEYRNGRK